MRRCLIVEDDHDNANYIANGMAEQGYSAIIASDGAEALGYATSQEWDIIILDRMLPNKVDGLAILSTLRSMGNKTPVLVLSALGALDERVKGLKAGGDDYLTKPFAFSELMARIEALMRRTNSREVQSSITVADLTLNMLNRKVMRGDKTISLQPREFRLLAYLMTHADQVVTRTMLLESVWGYHFDPQSNVIDVQVSRLRNKIDSGFQKQLIHTIRKTGYMLSDTYDPTKF